MLYFLYIIKFYTVVPQISKVIRSGKPLEF